MKQFFLLLLFSLSITLWMSCEDETDPANDADTEQGTTDDDGADTDSTDGDGSDGSATDLSGTDGIDGDGDGEGDDAGTDGSTDGATDGSATDSSGTDGAGTDGSSSDSTGTDGSGDDGSTPTGDPLEGLNILFFDQEIEGIIESREVIVQAPDPILDGVQYPLVFAFHGNGGVNDPWQFQLGGMVDDQQFIGVYPQGHLNSWNLGQEASTADDVAFVDMIIDSLLAFPNIDHSKRYAIGFSNGAAMVNRLGVQTDHFNAIAPCASQLLEIETPDVSTNPISVYQVCGTMDGVIPYLGGEAVMGHVFLPAYESAELWAENATCELTAEIDFIGTDTLFRFVDCEDGHEIRYYQKEGANHGLGVGMDPDFYPRIWDFFKLH